MVQTREMKLSGVWLNVWFEEGACSVALDCLSGRGNSLSGGIRHTFGPKVSSRNPPFLFVLETWKGVNAEVQKEHNEEHKRA